jgi:hypothetical protein
MILSHRNLLNHPLHEEALPNSHHHESFCKSIIHAHFSIGIDNLAKYCCEKKL